MSFIVLLIWSFVCLICCKFLTFYSSYSLILTIFTIVFECKNKQINCDEEHESKVVEQEMLKKENVREDVNEVQAPEERFMSNWDAILVQDIFKTFDADSKKVR